MLKNLKTFTILTFSFLGFLSCNNSEVPSTPQSENIIDYIEKDSSLSIFLSSLKSIGLENTLQTGSYTVFAPDNKALEDSLFDITSLSNQDQETLFRSHIINSGFTLENINPGRSSTLSNNDIFFSVKVDSTVFINGSIEITKANQEVDNGVIHSVNGLIVPPTLDIVGLLDTKDNLSTFFSLLEEGRLVSTLSNRLTSYTIFAPTNEAIAKLSRSLNLDLLSAEEKADLILYHVLPGYVFSTDLTEGELSTALGSNINVLIENNQPTLKGTRNASSIAISEGNLLGTNGVIHIIDSVLEP